MGDIVYSKCPCKECGNNIEFPAFAARTTIPCPHCGQWTELLPPGAVTEKTGLGAGTIAVIVCGLVVATGAFWLQFRKPPPDADSTATRLIVKVAPKPPENVVATPVPAPSPSIVVTQTVVQAPVKPTRPKSPTDLKVGAVALEKTPGSSLVFAVGTVKNDSDWERFGMKVELDLFNAKGDKIGTSEDQKDILEPRQEWQFRALIPEKHAVSAKVTSLKEQE